MHEVVKNNSTFFRMRIEEHKLDHWNLMKTF